MIYLLKETLRPDTIVNAWAAPGEDKFTYVSPYPGIRQKFQESIAGGHQERYYTENDRTFVDKDTGVITLQREFKTLEGVRDMAHWLANCYTGPDNKILTIWIECIDDNGNVTRENVKT